MKLPSRAELDVMVEVSRALAATEDERRALLRGALLAYAAGEDVAGWLGSAVARATGPGRTVLVRPGDRLVAEVRGGEGGPMSSCLCSHAASEHTGPKHDGACLHGEAGACCSCEHFYDRDLGPPEDMQAQVLTGPLVGKWMSKMTVPELRNIVAGYDAHARNVTLDEGMRAARDCAHRWGRYLQALQAQRPLTFYGPAHGVVGA